MKKVIILLVLLVAVALVGLAGKRGHDIRTGVRKPAAAGIVTR